jgi:uncharacterized repeat protein (TIGR03803 family)
MHLYNLKSLRVPAVLAAALAVLIFAGAAVPSQAQTPKTVYGFPGTPGPVNPNIEAIAQGRDGNLYFTAGGGDGKAVNCTVTYCGTAIKMTTAGAVTDVFDFSNNNCGADNCGNSAYGGLTLGIDGNFYGAFYYGGTTGNNGEVFKLTPAGVLTALHNFTGASDGSHPYGAPIQAASGIFYGTTSSATVADSTAYSVTSAGVFTTLHTFTGTDGQSIVAPLVQGADGNFYGDSTAGGTSNNGVIFKMTPAGLVTVLHNFAGTDGSNGSFPLIQAADGNFYGSTYSGGIFGAGVIFKITSGGVYTVLHNINGTTEGNGPWGALVQATNGKLYGVTSNMEIGLYGTIFSITTSGTFTTLYSFTDGADGGDPLSPLIQHTDGLLYGTTNVGGNTNCFSAVNINGQENIVVGCGELYSLNIGAKAFVSLVSTSGKVGSKIGILGQGFSASSVVKFNGVTATTVTRTGTTFLLATVPTGASDGNVTVTTGATTLTSSKKFTVHNSWRSGAAMPTPVYQPAAAVLNNEIYVVGGYTATAVTGDVQIYNPATNTWTSGASLPTATGAAAAAVVNGELYVIGGSTTTSVTGAVWAYSPTTKTWTSKATMPTARNGLVAVVEKNIIYVIGGNSGGGNFISTVESYNPATNTWKDEASMSGTKDTPAAGLIGTTIVVSGGSNVPGSVTGDTEAYNATTNIWSSLTADPTERTGQCAAVISGLLYDASGYINNGGAATTVNESFTLSTDKWTTTLAPIPQGTMFNGSAVVGGQLYCLGGEAVINSTPISNVQIYQP